MTSLRRVAGGLIARLLGDPDFKFEAPTGWEPRLYEDARVLVGNSQVAASCQVHLKTWQRILRSQEHGATHQLGKLSVTLSNSAAMIGTTYRQEHPHGGARRL
jgi:hypothetical protein